MKGIVKVIVNGKEATLRYDNPGDRRHKTTLLLNRLQSTLFSDIIICYIPNYVHDYKEADKGGYSRWKASQVFLRIYYEMRDKVSKDKKCPKKRATVNSRTGRFYLYGLDNDLAV
ncbi:hypothetical protein [Chitinophaga sp.]|uniref:hypothetical protein n=1 Tax=Chitinophaga sp. TaxID=1869181 RepID=UPI0031E35961